MLIPVTSQKAFISMVQRSVRPRRVRFTSALRSSCCACCCNSRCFASKALPFLGGPSIPWWPPVVYTSGSRGIGMVFRRWKTLTMATWEKQRRCIQPSRFNSIVLIIQMRHQTGDFVKLRNEAKSYKCTGQTIFCGNLPMCCVFCPGWGLCLLPIPSMEHHDHPPGHDPNGFNTLYQGSRE